MKQIKTIVTDMMEGKIFDQKVNEAIENGWVLIRRDVLVPHGQHRLSSLYAELERELGEVKRKCETCGHFREPLKSAPCRSCERVNGAPTAWEPIP